MLQIAFTLDAMQRYYNPDIHSYCETYNSAFGQSLGIDSKAENLPHMSLRFVGFEHSTSRRLLSIPQQAKCNKPFAKVEVGDNDASGEDFHTIHTHLQLSLGHEPNDEEIERYLKSRNGCRSMSGVTGDLMSYQTYVKHTLTTLKERGMVSGEDDVVMHVVADDPYSLRIRVAEAASNQINDLVEQSDEMQLARAYVPSDHANLTKEQIESLVNAECRRVQTTLYNTMDLPEHLDGLRKYACIGKSTMRKMTYHHRNKDREELNKERKSRKQVCVDAVDSSTQFKDLQRFSSKTFPGIISTSSTRAGVGNVYARGRQNARGKGRSIESRLPTSRSFPETSSNSLMDLLPQSSSDTLMNLCS
jgi:hypothetical protein